MASLPCVDEYAFENHNDRLDIEFNASSDDPHDHKNPSDICSPICVCACCGISVEEIGFQYFETPVPKKLTRSSGETHYKEPHSYFFLSEIWNPPRV